MRKGRLTVLCLSMALVMATIAIVSSQTSSFRHGGEANEVPPPGNRAVEDDGLRPMASGALSRPGWVAPAGWEVVGRVLGNAVGRHFVAISYHPVSAGLEDGSGYTEDLVGDFLETSLGAAAFRIAGSGHSIGRLTIDGRRLSPPRLNGVELRDGRVIDVGDVVISELQLAGAVLDSSEHPVSSATVTVSVAGVSPDTEIDVDSSGQFAVPAGLWSEGDIQVVAEAKLGQRSEKQTVPASTRWVSLILAERVNFVLVLALPNGTRTNAHVVVTIKDVASGTKSTSQADGGDSLRFSLPPGRYVVDAEVLRGDVALKGHSVVDLNPGDSTVRVELRPAVGSCILYVDGGDVYGWNRERSDHLIQISDGRAMVNGLPAAESVGGADVGIPVDAAMAAFVRAIVRFRDNGVEHLSWSARVMCSAGGSESAVVRVTQAVGAEVVVGRHAIDLRPIDVPKSETWDAAYDEFGNLGARTIRGALHLRSGSLALVAPGRYLVADSSGEATVELLAGDRRRLGDD